MAKMEQVPETPKELEPGRPVWWRIVHANKSDPVICNSHKIKVAMSVDRYYIEWMHVAGKIWEVDITKDRYNEILESLQ